MSIASSIFVTVVTIFGIIVLFTFISILVMNFDLDLKEFVILAIANLVSLAVIVVNVRNYKQITYTAPTYNINQMMKDFEPKIVYLRNTELGPYQESGKLEETIYFGKHEWIYYDDEANKPKHEPASMPRPEYLMDNVEN